LFLDRDNVLGALEGGQEGCERADHELEGPFRVLDEVFVQVWVLDVLGVLIDAVEQAQRVGAMSDPGGSVQGRGVMEVDVIGKQDQKDVRISLLDRTTQATLDPLDLDLVLFSSLLCILHSLSLFIHLDPIRSHSSFISFLLFKKSHESFQS
jgi:hypothetical protein